MGGKLSPIIIIVLVVALIGVAVVMFNVLKPSDKKGTKPVSNTTTSQTSTETTLSFEFDQKMEKNVVTISVEVTSDIEEEIEKIILPNKEEVMGNKATYTVEENGNYEFKAISESGEEASKKVKVTTIEDISATNPYIPDGFKELGGDIESGYVISDTYGNQYVWIPVESGKLTRNTVLNADYQESTSSASALVNSVAKYYGFYMARFEASQYEKDGEFVAATMQGKIPWTNITCLDAITASEKSAEAFGYTDCSTALVNSYAWDTALAWIDLKYSNYSSNTNYGNYTGTIYPTGATELDNVNNICDIAGNVREWTTEIYKGSISTKTNSKKAGQENITQRVVRGGSASLSRTPGSHIYYAENTADNYWGYRMILFKE